MDNMYIPVYIMCVYICIYIYMYMYFTPQKQNFEKLLQLYITTLEICDNTSISA